MNAKTEASIAALIEVEEFLRDMIDGGEECRGRDAAITEHIRTVEIAGRLIASAPELLHELEKAHQIITVLLNRVPSERKAELAEALAKLHDGDGAVRYHERAAVLAKATGASA